ncbi:uncharacterized protein DUF547 [Gelidibacter algens]|jgi:hypothetical protein|uniref:Uncharacterized protein DUF547 n=1 Tax=Gelidibacter algens TaxID=49280 RepID=A0A1A7R7S3_9FLAO|nr:DUF547 domain-containing protein [Gelidibacter algens]OBX26792.1 hypothetical protein A9996_02995 [Gelidibacter algens]RAJ22760.1 uncharacterized protein DUF547 [Gelidibacter algens]
MKNKILLFLLALSSIQLFSQDVYSFFEKTDSFLKANVADGKVDYDAIHSNPKSLNELMTLGEGISVSKDDKQTYQAFWINAYNLSVIKGIINNFPTKSPLDEKGFFDKTKYKLAGKSITLNDIENTILRAEFKDPRFHFVLVCGAIGCPPLINEVYMPKTLDAQLTKQTKLALNGNYFIKVNDKKKTVEGSEIMKWYIEDFTMNGGSEIDFINTYRDEKVPSNYKLTYSKYDWNLNRK